MHSLTRPVCPLTTMSQSRIFLGRVFPEAGTDIEIFLNEVDAKASFLQQSFYDVQADYGFLPRRNDISVAEQHEFGAELTALEKKAPVDSLERQLRDAQEQIQDLLNHRDANWETIKQQNGQLLNLQQAHHASQTELQNLKDYVKGLEQSDRDYQRTIDEQETLVIAYREAISRFIDLSNLLESGAKTMEFDEEEYKVYEAA